MQAQPPPPAAPPVYPTSAWPAPHASPREGSSKILAAGLSAIIFAGLLTYHAVFFVIPPGSPFGGSPSPERVEYQLTIRILGMASAVLMDIAVAVAVAFALFTATRTEGVPDSTRRGLLTFAATFVTVWIVISSFVYSGFRSFFFF